MQPVPKKHQAIIEVNKYYFGHCIFCGAHPEIDHVFQYARKQIVEVWNYVPVCTHHHRLGPMAKMNNSIIREAIELHCMEMEKVKNEMCAEVGVAYTPISGYNKTGSYSQSFVYLRQKKDEINEYLTTNGLCII